MKKKLLCLICAILFVVPLIVSCRSGYKYDYDDFSKYITLADYKNAVITVERDYIQSSIDDTILGYATDVYTAQKGDDIYVNLSFAKVVWTEGKDGKIDQEGEKLTALDKTDFLIENVGNGSYCSQIEEMLVGPKASVQLGKDYKEIVKLDSSFPVEEYRNTEVYLSYKFSSIRAKKGDVVKVTYKGYHLKKDSETEVDKENSFDSGSTTFYLGSHLAIDDFENNLIGAKVNEKIEFYATFPEDYDELTEGSMNGKKTYFEATITNIYKTPTYTDEFVKEKLGFETRKDFENSLVEDFATLKMMEIVVDGSTLIKYPEREYYDFMESFEAFTYAFQQNNGYPYDLYLQIYEGTTSEEYINSTLKLELAYYAFAKAENLVPSEEQLNTAKEGLIALHTENYQKQNSSLSYEDARKQAEDYVKNELGKAGVYDEAIFKLVEDHFKTIYTIEYKDATYTSVTTEKMPPMEDSAK